MSRPTQRAVPGPLRALLSLRVQVSLALALGAGACAFVAGKSSVDQVAGAYADAAQDTLHSLGRSDRSQVTMADLRNPERARLRAVRVSELNPNVVAAAVYRRTGDRYDLIAATGSSSPTPPAVGDRAPLAAGRPVAHERRAENLHEEVLLLPRAGGEAALSLTYDLTPHDGALSRRNRPIALVLAALLAGYTAFAGWLLGRGIFSPLDRLRQATREIAGGRLDTRLGWRRRDELGVLASDFDDMAGELERANEQLRSVERDARDRAEQAARKARGLESVADVALAQLPLDELLPALLERICTALDAPTATILMRDAERGELVPRAAHGGRWPAPDTTWHSAPLVVEQKRSIGVLRVGLGAGRDFTPDDIKLLGLAASRIAGAIERAGVNDQMHRIAETLQRSLLPSHLPQLPGLEIASRYLPGAAGTKVGGDLYDVFRYPDGRVAVALGDVAGHGIEAAVMMGRLRTALQAYAVEGDPPDRVIQRLQRLANGWGHELMATLLYLVLDPGTATVTFVRAGHLPPLVRAPDGSTRLLTGGDSLPLGVGIEEPIRVEVAALEPGSTLLLYTDGLVEERGVSLSAGIERLRRALAEAPADPETLADRVLEDVRPDGAAHDDIALLAVRLSPLAVQRIEFELPARADSLPELRERLDSFLAGVGAKERLVFDFMLATCEAATNAIRHAYRSHPDEGVYSVRLRRDEGDVEVTVRDYGAWAVPTGEDDDFGRGIGLMQSLMDSADVVTSAGGTTVTLRSSLEHEGGGNPAAFAEALLEGIDPL